MSDGDAAHHDAHRAERRPRRLHDLGRRRAGRDAPADAAHVRARGLIEPKRSPKGTRLYSQRRRRAAAPHPGDDGRAGHEPRRRRARVRARGAARRDDARRCAGCESARRAAQARSSGSRSCAARCAREIVPYVPRRRDRAGASPRRPRFRIPVERPSQDGDADASSTASRSSPRRRSRPRSGWPTSARNPQVDARAPARGAARAGGRHRRPGARASSAPTRARSARDAERARSTSCPTVSGAAAGEPRPSERAGAGAARRRARDARARRRVRLDRAPAARARRRTTRRPATLLRAPARRTSDAAAGAQRGARPAPRHRPEPRGQVPGARAATAAT